MEDKFWKKNALLKATVAFSVFALIVICAVYGIYWPGCVGAAICIFMFFYTGFLQDEE